MQGIKQKIIAGLTGITALVITGGCGTVIRVKDEKSGIFYTCNLKDSDLYTDPEDPCGRAIAEYRKKHPVNYPSTSSESKDYSLRGFGMAAELRATRESTKSNKGHYENCP